MLLLYPVCAADFLCVKVVIGDDHSHIAPLSQMQSCKELDSLVEN